MAYRAQKKKMFVSSSFQTHSIPMLHIISEIDPTIPIYFINTGYLFPETLSFRDKVASLLGLSVHEVRSHVSMHQQRGADGKLLFTSDPDYCCYLNKTQPLDVVLLEYDVWINGVRRDQNAIRKNMSMEQPAQHGCIRFHPMLEWNTKDIYAYIKTHKLPKHPLDAQGYLSVGCEPCTRKVDVNMQEREARWYGLNKVECGLHTDLIGPTKKIQ